jgi:membrane-associated protein
VHVLANPIAPDHLLSSFGLIGLAVILFAECGLLVGFFLPGDTLLLSAGIALAVGKIHTPLAAFLVVAPLAAIAGNLVGYWIGYRTGPAVFNRPDSRLFRPEFVIRSQAFFDRFGWATIFLARFVPIVRTVATVLAGVSRMPFVRYAVASTLGGIVWTVGILLAGYWLGQFDFVRAHEGWIDYLVIVMVLLSLLPTVIHYVLARRRADPVRD